METIIVTYILNGPHGEILSRRRVSKEPQFGDIVTINDRLYEVREAEYDHIVWRSTGAYIYDVVVKQLKYVN